MALRPSRRLLPALPALLALAAALTGCGGLPSPDVPPAGSGEGYLFCFWNVENLFDDVDDGEKRKPDKEFDVWFSRNSKAREQKYANLCQVLLKMNGGKGPDILGLAEVETYRAAELLRDALNARLPKGAAPYGEPIWKDPAGGRHIACALLSRLKAPRSRAELLGRRLRILKAHVEADGADLVVVVSHWASRLRDKGPGRAKYGDQIYGDFKATYLANPKVAYLVCGDFNDNPDDASVTEHLRATSDRDAVLKAPPREPRLYNVLAPLWTGPRSEKGSHFYRGRTYLFDQICLSPGLLDGQGWSYVKDSAKIVPELADRKGHPLRFGNEHDKLPPSERGASDHFPVTVRLKVNK
jgi:endonuclease/exonuclease/phosphatase family metal-dependent hydrolase